MSDESAVRADAWGSERRGGDPHGVGLPEPRLKATERLVCLDAVRGLTVSVMIFVDYLGDWIYPAVVNHSTWDGMLACLS